MKFKIGDRVKILPSVMNVGLPEDEVGKIVRVTGGYGLDIYISDSRGDKYGSWSVYDYDIVLVPEIWEQLTFSFMEDV